MLAIIIIHGFLKIEYCYSSNETYSNETLLRQVSFLKLYINLKLYFQMLFQGFTKILVGEMDHLPEIAFYMVGPIEEVAAKAETLAKSS